MLHIIALILIVIVLIVVGISAGISKYKKRKQNLADKFDNLLKWKVGDRIKIKERGHYQNYRIAIFKKDGIWAFEYESDYDKWSRLQGQGLSNNVITETIGVSMEFLPTYKIEKNVDIEKRNRYLDIKSELEEDYSYHNQLVMLQDEYQKLNDELPTEVKSKIKN